MRNLSKMPIYKTPYREISVKLNEGTSIPSPSNGTLLIGNRTVLPAGDTYFKPLRNQPGYPFVDNYEIYQLPNFTSGIAALGYMKNLGFQVSYGEEGAAVLSAPSSITNVASASVTLTFDAVSAENEGWSEFAINNPNIVSEFTQQTSGATGTAVSYTSNTQNSTVSVALDLVTGAFDDTNLISVSYVNSSVQIPNAAKTDEICCQVHSFFTTLNNPQQTIVNSVIPPLYISVVPDPATVATSYFGPTSQPIPLAEAGLSIVGTGTEIDLYFDTAIPQNFFMIPSKGLGVSTISQGATSGRIAQTLPGSNGPAGSLCGVRLTNVSGTFETTSALSINLDSSQDIFALLSNTEVGYVNSPYEIKTSEDVNTTYSEFFDGIKALNEPFAVMQNHFVIEGIVSNLSYAKYEYANLPEINSQYFQCCFYPYAASKSPKMYPGQLGASYAALISQPGVPFIPINNSVALGVFTNYKKSEVIGKGIDKTSELVLDKGWIPFSVNDAGEVYIIRAVTSLLTTQAGLPDIEYFPASIWQIISEWKKAVYYLTLETQFTNARANPKTKQALEAAVQGLALTFQQLGMFENLTTATIKKITVTDSLTDPSALIINTPVTIVPELNAISVLVNVESALNVSVSTV